MLSTEKPRPALPRGASRCSWGDSDHYQPRPALQYCRQQPPHEDESSPAINLILIKPSERSMDTGAVDLEPNHERTNHILSHLKKTTGDIVSVGFVDSLGGCTCKAVVLQRQNGGVRLIPKPNTIVLSPSLPKITLLLAVPSPARLKYLWPVIASFSAVTRVVIVKAKLSNPDFMLSKALQPSMYEPMIENGMSQGGRTRPVQVDICPEDESMSRNLLERLGLVCNNNTDGTARLFLDCGDEYVTPPPARDIVLEQCGKKRGNVPSAILVIGPERGWTDNEAKIFVKCGFQSAMLGSSTLRADTAVMSGLGIVSAALDECHKQKQSDQDYK
mmetsp:Transcript_28709/g.51894  ORF Transcript_28709/g.51894 Transcript_28709/m.51894 type:complete len:331 (+) Transcript_28709:253-1245(+)